MLTSLLKLISYCTMFNLVAILSVAQFFTKWSCDEIVSRFKTLFIKLVNSCEKKRIRNS